ncbi:MAG: hypothetical protein IKD89_03025 [Clostridia bacterium]|nr:hypothetical protein [Clostridia bacterium]
MKITKKSLLCIALAAVMALSLAACQSNQKKPDVTYTNNGIILTVPGDYDELVTVDMPEASEDGILFSVSENASVEAAAASEYDTEGAGWLFAIGTVSEDKLHEMLCYDMSGAEVFAKDAEGNCYIYYHPTDVRIMREGDITDEDMAQWSALCEWAAGVPASITTEEDIGLTEEKRGNTDLDIYLNRSAYMDGTIYTVSTTEFGPKTGDGAIAQPYVDRLTKGMTLEMLDISETPDGEYAVLYFPVDDMRFDFFFAEDKVNYIRQIWSGNEALYKAAFADGETNAAEVMNEWYHALIEAGAQGTENVPADEAADGAAGAVDAASDAVEAAAE